MSLLLSLSPSPSLRGSGRLVSEAVVASCCLDRRRRKKARKTGKSKQLKSQTGSLARDRELRQRQAKHTIPSFTKKARSARKEKKDSFIFVQSWEERPIAT